MTSKRLYDSPLRAEQAAQTRVRILHAMTDLLADPTVEEITIPRVALRARVSLRTVYRHFPTRESLFDDWGDWVDERLKLHLHSYPERPENLVEFASDLYRAYDENEPLVRAMLFSKAARGVRVRTRRLRQRAFERAMSDVTGGMSPHARARAIAVVYLLVSAPAWQAMRDQWGMDGIEAGRAAAWAVRVLIEELRRNPVGVEQALRLGSPEPRPAAPAGNKPVGTIHGRQANRTAVSMRVRGKQDSSSSPLSRSESRGGARRRGQGRGKID